MRLSILLTVVALSVAVVGPLGAQPAPTATPAPPDPTRLAAVPADVTGPNPWLERQVLNIAHRGGAFEWPENTMFAYREALLAGADVLETDVALTADGHVVVLHDQVVDRTTDWDVTYADHPANDDDERGSVVELTLAEVQALDAAYWVPRGTYARRDLTVAEYPWRGMATGVREPVAGYTPEWFRVPTLRQVLETFPGVPLNIEIKEEGDHPEVPLLLAEKVAGLLQEFGRHGDAIVVSAVDQAARWFDLYGPDIDTATSTAEAAAFIAASGSPEAPGSEGVGPGLPHTLREALQVPRTQIVEIVTDDFVADAHASGLAVHVFTIDPLAQMREVLDMGVDGVMTNEVTRLEAELAARGTGYDTDPALIPACPAPDTDDACANG